jgi:hypothetical protein
MSINGQFRQVSPRALDLLRARPELVPAALDWRPLHPDPGDPFADLPAATRAILECLPAEMHVEAAARMRQSLAGLPGLADLYAEETEALKAAGTGDDDLPEALDIRKSWHPLHFVLCGQAWDAPWPMGAVVLGGEPLGDDMGYGPARVLTPAQVMELADALQALGDAGVLARYAPAELEAADIAPSGWEDPGEDEERREWMLDTWREVRDYYVDARRRGYGMILALV